MKAVSEVSALVVDHGLFLPVARRLAQDFQRVYYFTPHERSFLTVKDLAGSGYPDIERVESPWQKMSEVDCCVFPDVGFSHLQEHIRSMGLPVWGSGKADRLELSRGAFLRALNESGLAVPEHMVIHGLSQLKEHLRDKQDLWIKVSRFRGDFETMHWRTMQEDETRLDALAVRLGPFREEMTFYVFAPIETEIEDGCDAWVIDGVYPEQVIHGMEAKDRAWLGAWQKYSELPEPLRRVSDAFAPILKKHGARSFFSTEVRITPEGESFFIDPTVRAGSPPSQAMTEMIGNYSEVIWHGANGIVTQPDPVEGFGVQALIHSSGDPKEWRSLKLVPELEQWAKFHNSSFQDGCVWVPPDPDATSRDIGWLVGIGDTMEAAIQHLKENSELLTEGTTCDYSALVDVIKEAEAAEEQGMEFSEQPTPGPEVVLD